LEDGRYPSFAPYPNKDDRYTGMSAWADAGTIVPWCVYLNYADRRLLQEHFESARRWVDHLHRENQDLISTQKSHGVDWLNIGGSIPEKLFATAFFAKSTEIVAGMAAILGKDNEAEKYNKLHEAIKAAFICEFVQEDGTVAGDSQGGYALALAFNLVPEDRRGQIAAKMVEALKKNDGKMTTGIATTHHLLLELSRNGYHQEACRLVQSRQMPSWGFMVEQGATTIWERWDGYVPDPYWAEQWDQYVPGTGFGPNAMNSFNHFVLGAVGEWMMRELAGINPDQSQPGYKHFSIRPRIGNTLTWVKAHYDSLHGQIASNWKLDSNIATLSITIPANTGASVWIPTKNIDSITEGGKKASQSEGVYYLRTEGDAVVFDVDSGGYEFAWQI